MDTNLAWRPAISADVFLADYCGCDDCYDRDHPADDLTPGAPMPAPPPQGEGR